jgi:molybdopterin/thiamine biosynthesis adenylyltransferase
MMMIKTLVNPRATTSSPDHATAWSYDTAFGRNRGLISSAEQDKLRNSRVAIAGLGGVGGVHLVTLARLGIGAFHVADPDRFELANFNRQYGATTRSLGRSKAKEMAETAAAINPQADLGIFTEAITSENVGRFLHGVDVLVDGIDFFAIEARRLLFREARRRGIWAVTAGPLGFSSAWLVFDPHGMSFDDYFDLHDDMDRWEQIIAFAVGLAPRATHLGYLDLSAVDPQSGRGPSAGLACQLCAGVAAAEIVKILLDRRPIPSAPCFSQFDAYRGILRTGRLRWGNRHPLQRLKRWYLRRRMRSLGLGERV